MDEEVKKLLEIMNANLNAIVKNQDILYCKLQEIADELKEKE